jgi:RNase P/RNase MRP subunit p29
MINTKTLSLLAAASVALSSAVFAADAKSDYQVTGPVLDVTDSMIVVQKGKERWEITRNSSTKTTGDVKKGDKVTIQYGMTATSIEVKAADKSATKDAKKK